MAELGSMFNKEEMINYAPITGIGGGSPSKEPFGPNVEQQNYAERAVFNRDDRGAAFGELLRTAENKTQVLLAVRQLMTGYESMKYHPESGISPYSLERSIGVCQERSQTLAIPVDRLRKKGIIGKTVRLNDENGRRGEYSTSGAGFGISQTVVIIEKPAGYDTVLDRNGVERHLPKVVYVEQPYTYLGTDQERREMSETFDKGYGEIIVRKNLHEAYQHFNSNTENLPGLANFYLYRWMTPEGIKLLFNLAAEDEAPDQNSGGAKYDKEKQMGQMLNDAIMLYKIIGESERKQSFIDLMNRPGFEAFLVPKGWDRDRIIKEWFDTPEDWVEDAQRSNKDIVGKNEKASRGKLTEFGNIWTNSTPEEMKELRRRVREFLGNGDADNETAKTVEALAYKFFRVMGMADEVGYQLYGDGMHTDMGAWTSSDMTKVIHTDAFQSQYDRQGRDAGPKDTRGRYKGFATDLPNYLTTTLEDSLHQGENAMVFSLHERVWGYNEQELTLPPVRIGDLAQKDWDGFHDKFINSFFLRIFMAGREENGTFFQVTNTEWDPRKLSDYATYEKLKKALDVGLQPSAIPGNRGNLRGKSEAILKEEKKAYLASIVEAYLEGVEKSEKWDQINAERVIDGTAGIAGTGMPHSTYRGKLIEKAIELSRILGIKKEKNKKWFG